MGGSAATNFLGTTTLMGLPAGMRKQKEWQRANSECHRLPISRPWGERAGIPQRTGVFDASPNHQFGLIGKLNA